MSIDNIIMRVSRDNIKYEMSQIITGIIEEKKYEDQFIQDNKAEIIDGLASAITDLGILVNNDAGLTIDSKGEQTYQLCCGNSPVFFNLEKNIVYDIVYIVFSAIIILPDDMTTTKESIVKCIAKIVFDIFKLYYSRRIQINNEDYCVYIRCQHARNDNGIISKNDIVSFFKDGLCSGEPTIPKIGICTYFGQEGRKCRNNEDIVPTCLKHLCDAGVLKPLGEGIYRFYR